MCPTLGRVVGFALRLKAFCRIRQFTPRRQWRAAHGQLLGLTVSCGCTLAVRGGTVGTSGNSSTTCAARIWRHGVILRWAHVFVSLFFIIAALRAIFRSFTATLRSSFKER